MKNPKKSESEKTGRRAASSNARVVPPAKPKAAVGQTRSARDAQAVASVGQSQPKSPLNPGFGVVGIGASAGGLEALVEFLSHVPPASGLAFLVVQHLAPDHKALLSELLQHATAMRVRQAEDRMRVQKDCVYVIPPNADMSILRGVLHLFEPATPRGQRLPIDFLFRSMADDLGELAVGVILSGMGSDGTLGLRAIRAKGGPVLVQEPASAKFDSMPLSAIDAGLADVVAPPAELPARILAYLHHVACAAPAVAELTDKDGTSLEKIAILVRAKTGHDFSQYKPSTLARRVERRMAIHRIADVAGYVRHLQANSQEVDLLFNELLIGVTSFFRDPPMWEQLRDEAFPRVFANHPEGGLIRAWSAGCSTGEEPYSLAIAFKEALERVGPKASFVLRIFASDLSRAAIDRARSGAFPVGIAADVSPERLRRHFVKEDDGYRVGKDIREMVTFATHNVIMDPPFTKLDILVFRNVLIYLRPELQKQLLTLFHYSLNPGGILALGSAETVGSFTSMFKPLAGKTRLYERLATGTSRARADLPTANLLPSTVPRVSPADKKEAPSLNELAEQLLLRQYSPPAVLVTDKGDIVHVSGHTGKYLEPAAGKANWNVFAMAREGLLHQLTSGFHRALGTAEKTVLHGLDVQDDGATRRVDVAIELIQKPAALRGMVMIVFNEVPAPSPAAGAEERPGRPGRSRRAAELDEELRRTRQELQSSREEMQIWHEEVTSTNEELQSANEELQSINEELTTSKEELQSLNEELQTVNAEQAAKMAEISLANNDLSNLLHSTNVATVFLDARLDVRRFTPGAMKLFKLLPGDVGRPLADITTELLYPQLFEDAKEVLRTLAYCEHQKVTRDGRWFAVRIMPYRTVDDRIDGVVITFNDVSVAKSLESELRQTGKVQREILDTLREGVLHQAADGTVLYANHAARRILGLSLTVAGDRPFLDPRWGTVRGDGTEFPEGARPLQETLAKGIAQRDVIVGVLHGTTGRRVWVRVSTVPVFRTGGDKPDEVCSTFEVVAGHPRGTVRPR